ncbi:DMT family transporter [Streptomonospora algeriensis]|uniref:DMT family transporter n=1 Tax=Streptomonospora algeriensis TaxID=995084 RepID=A0ABW3BBH0_9ACTN
MAIAWGILVAAGLLEIVWSLALKNANGLKRPGWAALGVGVAMVSLGMLSYALRDLPVGTAYAAWVGIGAVGVAVVGMLFYREPASRGRLLSLAAIIAGVIGLNLTGG